MAALRDIARDVAEEIRDGIGWVIVYRTGRSWSALTLWSDLGSGEWETDDLNDAIGILKTDPDAVVLNGYYCGHFGEGMTIDEIAAGIRWHYEGGHNRLADYYEVEQGLNAIEEARKTAEAAGLPFCERLAEGPDDELDPYTYDGSMSSMTTRPCRTPEQPGRSSLPSWQHRPRACLPRSWTSWPLRPPAYISARKPCSRSSKPSTV